jgi:hypothetical protein
MMPMTYDLDFRYRRALQPEGLSTVLTAVRAVEDAIQDARNAGLDPDTSADQPLRAACLARIADLKSKPAIVALVRRGVDFEPETRRAFHHEASRALRQIACELAIAHDLYTIHHDSDQFGVAGDVTLASATVHLRISATRLRPGREITYRAARSRHDEFGGPPQHADISRLADIARFARQIARDLKLTAPCGQDRFL